MDRFESMSMLVAAVEAGSLSAAARRLSMPLATVSRKVSELEQHLGTRLLNRTSRQLSLTDAGRNYLAACKRILEQLQEAEQVASGEYAAPKGELVVAAPLMFGRLHVLPVVLEFLQAYPEIDVRLSLSDRATNLFEERIDVALRIGALADSSLVATRIGAIRRVVSGSPGYFATHKAPKRPEELHDHACISFEAVSSPLEWVFDGPKKPLRVAVHSRLVVDTADAAIEAAIAGIGITRVFCYQIAAAERDGSLRRILRDFEPEALPIHLVYAPHSLVPLKLRAFLDFAAPRLKARL